MPVGDTVGVTDGAADGTLVGVTDGAVDGAVVGVEEGLWLGLMGDAEGL